MASWCHNRSVMMPATHPRVSAGFREPITPGHPAHRLNPRSRCRTSSRSLISWPTARAIWGSRWIRSIYRSRVVLVGPVIGVHRTCAALPGSPASRYCDRRNPGRPPRAAPRSSGTARPPAPGRVPAGAPAQPGARARRRVARAAAPRRLRADRDRPRRSTSPRTRAAAPPVRWVISRSPGRCPARYTGVGRRRSMTPALCCPTLVTGA